MFHHIISYDIDYYLLKFLFIADIANLKMINSHLNKLITKTKINQQMMQLIGIAENNIIEKCYERGLLKILKNYYQNNKNIIINNRLEITAKNGHIAVLNWFKNCGFEFKYNSGAINDASKNGHIAVLDWFKNSGFKFKYDNLAIDYASANGHIAVLNWFKNSGFKIEYDEYVINCALFNGHTAVLDWLKNSGLEFKE